ncbi:MAG: cobalamin biosynthesis protein CobD [Alphaproteobacteria bacterium]|nr:MAG: cobalamin biosynthesis protein CobD [Alphaproteobacteria bacterium]
MTHLEMLIAALILDAVLGEPRWIWSRIPHPVVLMGRMIAWLDRRLHRGEWLILRGALTVLLPAIPVAAIAIGITFIPDYGVLELIGAAILLAHRSLVDHLRAVRKALEDSLEMGRLAVSRIVGRDTDVLDESGVSRAAIESGAENFSDGVIAPAFWFLLFGLPGIALYKLVNTADSMIGHADEHYFLFGRVAARLDDLLNWFPSRLSGAILTVASLRQSAGDVMVSDASLHVSPSAGWPEAATAGALGIALSGPRCYDGEWTDDPWINSRGRRELTARDIKRATRLIWRAWVLVVLVLAGAEAIYYQYVNAPI